MLTTRQTWTRRRVGIIVGVAVFYGVWFNYLDSAAYCEDQVTFENCISVGQTLGGNQFYQPWNIIGHCIPGLFLLLLTPKKVELFLAGVLISSAVMDSPLWGAMRFAHVPPLPLWHIQGDNDFAITWSLWEWTVYYYNPIGGYQVWEDYWLAPGLPTAAMIFWSVALRLILAAVLIIWQNRQEEEGREFSLKDIVLFSKLRKGKGTDSPKPTGI
jgi:hypothetical protein